MTEKHLKLLFEHTVRSESEAISIRVEASSSNQTRPCDSLITYLFVIIDIGLKISGWDKAGHQDQELDQKNILTRSPGPLVRWSFGPLVPSSFGLLAVGLLLSYSAGPLPLRSLGLLVRWYGPSVLVAP